MVNVMIADPGTSDKGQTVPMSYIRTIIVVGMLDCTILSEPSPVNSGRHRGHIYEIKHNFIRVSQLIPSTIMSWEESYKHSSDSGSSADSPIQHQDLGDHV